MRLSNVYEQRNSRCAQTNIYSVDLVESGTPGNAPSGVQFFQFSSANFGPDNKTVNSSSLAGKQYVVFWNEAQRYLKSSELSIDPAGAFTILIPTFNSTNGNYTFFVTTVSSPGIGAGPVEPVTLDQAKAQCRVDFADDDVIIQRLISDCRQAIENLCHISLVQKTATVTLDLITDTEIPEGPTVSIVSFKDSTGTDIDASMYEVWGNSFQHIRPTMQHLYRSTLVYTTGPSGPVQWQLQEAILQEIAFRYENRGDGTQLRNNVNPGICDAAEELSRPFKRLAWQ